MLIHAVMAHASAWYNGRRQRMVLTDLFMQCGGRGWARRRGWLQEEEGEGGGEEEEEVGGAGAGAGGGAAAAASSDLSSWEGVKTDSEGNVLEVTLPRNGLTGVIPQTLPQCR